MKVFLTQILILLSVGGWVVAQEAPAVLRVGDPAPALKFGKFLQGDPVTELTRDHAYVVEFWATWCGPCKQTIPHLNELHQKLAEKGLIVIGQNVFEQDDIAVAPFIKDMGDRMTYRVALDDKSEKPDGAMAELWMKAAGKNSIPTAFVVGKDGKIAWIGHPGEMQASLLEQVLDGTYDVAAAVQQAATVAGKAKETSVRQRALHEAVEAKNWPAAEKALTEFSMHLDPNRRKSLRLTRLQILLGQKRTEEATQLAEKIATEEAENVMMTYQLANTLANGGADSPAALEQSEKFARQALEKSDEKSRSACQSLLARILFQRGQKDAAIQAQTEALTSAPEASKPRLQKVLDEYKGGSNP